MPVKITYFVHGATKDNENNLATGQADTELSKTGIAEAKQLASLITDYSFDAIFCSDLKRASATADIVFGKKFKIITDERLREANYGDLNRKSDSFKKEMTNYIDRPFPNGESYLDVQNRVTDFLKFLKNYYQKKHIAIVSHQGPQLALDVLLNKKTWEQAITEDWRNKKAWQPGWKYKT